MIDEGLLDFCLAAWIGGAEEIEQVRILEKLGGHVGVGRRHGEGEVVLCLARAEVELVLDLQFEDRAAPAVGEGLADAEIAGRGVFHHLHEANDLAPGQLRNRLFRNWALRRMARTRALRRWDLIS